MHVFWNPTIFDIVRWFAGSMGHTTHRPSVSCSKFFFFIIYYRLWALKTLYTYFYKVIKKIERIFAKNFARDYKKKIILGSSEAWLMSRLSQQPSILFWKMFNFCFKENFSQSQIFQGLHLFPDQHLDCKYTLWQKVY